jgi:hypothetical protein
MECRITLDGRFISVRLRNVSFGFGQMGHYHFQMKRKLDSMIGWMVNAGFGMIIGESECLKGECQ